nr:hypothetical protein [uncultured Kingella sp.]
MAGIKIDNSVLVEVEEFGRSEYQGGGGANKEQVDKLLNIIKSSPYLTIMANSATQLKTGDYYQNNQQYYQGEHYMEGFRLETGKEKEGAFTTQRMVKIKQTLLENPDKHYYAVFAAGHELRHALDRVYDYFSGPFLDSMIDKSKQPEPRDYTAEVVALIRYERNSESRAELAGFNAVVSALWEQHHRKPTWEEIYSAAPEYMGNFIVEDGNVNNPVYAPNPSLAFDKDGYLSLDNARNLEAIGARFFDNPSVPDGYPDRIAAQAIRAAIRFEQQEHGSGSKPCFNMQELGRHGVDKASLQVNDVDFSLIRDCSPQPAAAYNPTAVEALRAKPAAGSHTPESKPEPAPKPEQKQEQEQSAPSFNFDF